jgi:hypothetical protein
VATGRAGLDVVPADVAAKLGGEREGGDAEVAEDDAVRAAEGALRREQQIEGDAGSAIEEGG